MRAWFVWIPMLLLAVAAAAPAQSLAEVAKKEKERRATLGKKGKAFTEVDLGAGPILPPAPAASDSTEPGGEPAEAVSDESEEEDTTTEDPTQTRQYWRDRLEAVDKRIADIETQLNQPGFDQDPSNLRRRTRLERELAQARAERQKIVDEARRKGVPPGWLR